MKRTILLSVLFAAALFCSCEKNTDPDKPSIAWAANPKFGQMELSPSADGNISISVPAGLESLTLTLGLGSYNILANDYIDNSTNKGSGTKNPVLDIIDDAKSAAFINSLSMFSGPSLRGKTLTTLDLVAIIKKLLAGQEDVIPNNTSFSIDVNIIDKSANELTKKTTFHFTAAPSFSWDGNKSFDIVDLTDDSYNAYKVKVNAPGKVERLSIMLDSSADAQLIQKIQNRTTAGILTIDLVNDEKVASEFKNWFPTGSGVTGKTDVSLDFSFMRDWRSDFGSGVNIFTIFVQDANGKNASIQVKFKK